MEPSHYGLWVSRVHHIPRFARSTGRFVVGMTIAVILAFVVPAGVAASISADPQSVFIFRGVLFALGVFFLVVMAIRYLMTRSMRMDEQRQWKIYMISIINDK